VTRHFPAARARAGVRSGIHCGTCPAARRPTLAGLRARGTAAAAMSGGIPPRLIRPMSSPPGSATIAYRAPQSRQTAAAAPGARRGRLGVAVIEAARRGQAAAYPVLAATSASKHLPPELQTGTGRMIERVVPRLAVTDHPAGSAWPLCCNATQSGVALVIGMGVDITRHTVNDRARNGATAAQRRGNRSRRPGAAPALPDRQAWRQRRHYRRAGEMIRLAGERQGHQPATEAGCPGGGVTTGSEPAPADAAPGLGRGCARVTGGGCRQVPLPDRHAGLHLQACGPRMEMSGGGR
jgi:hypothetical protein